MHGQQNIKFHCTDILRCTVNRTLKCLELVARSFAIGSWFFIYIYAQQLAAPLNAKERPDVSGIAAGAGRYKFQTVSFVKINQTTRPSLQPVYIFLLSPCPALFGVSTVCSSGSADTFTLSTSDRLLRSQPSHIIHLTFTECSNPFFLNSGFNGISPCFSVWFIRNCFQIVLKMNENNAPNYSSNSREMKGR
jgi:hypothetical protein